MRGWSSPGELENQRSRKEERRLSAINGLRIRPKTRRAGLRQFRLPHSVIGSMEDLDAAAWTTEAFFKTYYAPNNAVSLVGDLDTRHPGKSGNISATSRGRLRRCRPTSPNPPGSERRGKLPTAGAPHGLDIAYRIPPSSTPDAHAPPRRSDSGAGAVAASADARRGAGNNRALPEAVQEKELDQRLLHTDGVGPHVHISATCAPANHRGSGRLIGRGRRLYSEPSLPRNCGVMINVRRGAESRLTRLAVRRPGRCRRRLATPTSETDSDLQLPSRRDISAAKGTW